MIASVETYFAFGMTWPDSCRYFECKEPGQYSMVDPQVLCCGGDLHTVQEPLDALRHCRRTKALWRVEITEITEVTRGECDLETWTVGRTGVARATASLEDLVRAQIELMLDGRVADAQVEFTTVWSGLATVSEDRGIAVATEPWGAAAATRYLGVAAATGKRGTAAVSGHSGLSVASEAGGTATSSGTRGVAVASGKAGTATASGPGGLGRASGRDCVVLVSGNRGIAVATGDRSVAVAAGARSTATAFGNNSIAVAAGEGGRVCGSLGSWIVVAEHDGDGRVIDVRSLRVDGEQVLADTYYALRDGRVVETTEEEPES